MKKKSPSEIAEQTALVAKCKMENIFIFAIENSMHFPMLNSFSQATKQSILSIFAKLVQQRKNCGMVEGIPDLFIPELKLFIEMKTIDGKVAPHQLLVHNMLRRAGYEVFIGYGAKAAWEHIQLKRNNNE
jgi:hypothetical protein